MRNENKHQIIIEEDEENQTSGQRGDMHSRSESNINKVNEFIPTTDINNNNNCGNSSNSKQQQQRKHNKPKYETFNNIFSSGICEPQVSLFSYNEFYTRFKQTILNKKHLLTSTTTT